MTYGGIEGGREGLSIGGSGTLENLINRTREIRREGERVGVEMWWRDGLRKAEANLYSADLAASSAASESSHLATCLRALHNRVIAAGNTGPRSHARIPIRETGRDATDASAGCDMSDVSSEVSECTEGAATTLAAYWALDESAGKIVRDYADPWFSAVDSLRSKAADAHEEARAARNEYRRLNAAVSRLLAENQHLRSQVRQLEGENAARTECGQSSRLAPEVPFPMPMPARDDND